MINASRRTVALRIEKKRGRKRNSNRGKSEGFHDWLDVGS